jgi:hypothetical protein
MRHDLTAHTEECFMLGRCTCVPKEYVPDDRQLRRTRDALIITLVVVAALAGAFLVNAIIGIP